MRVREKFGQVVANDKKKKTKTKTKRVKKNRKVNETIQGRAATATATAATTQLQGSISSTFYEHLFCTKMLFAAFMCLQPGFVIFWQKEISAKAACKMLVILTTGVNFINFLRVAVSYEMFCVPFLYFMWPFK